MDVDENIIQSVIQRATHSHHHRTLNEQTSIRRVFDVFADEIEHCFADALEKREVIQQGDYVSLSLNADNTFSVIKAFSVTELFSAERMTRLILKLPAERKRRLPGGLKEDDPSIQIPWLDMCLYHFADPIFYLQSFGVSSSVVNTIIYVYFVIEKVCCSHCAANCICWVELVEIFRRKKTFLDKLSLMCITISALNTQQQ